MSLGDVAAKLGLPCFPCGDDKRPVVATGFKAASTDPSHIRAMFDRDGARLIGVPTGEASGLVVIDIDVRGDRNGMDWLDANADALPQTRTHKTRSGGLHLLFRYPEGHDIRNSAGRVAAGVDVRGNGGYMITPPSDGYQVADPVEPADMPMWLIRACLPPEAEPRPVFKRGPARRDGGSAYGLAALQAECDGIRAAGFGTQETTLNSACLKIGALVAGGEIEEGIARADLLAAGRSMASEGGREPWSAPEVETKVRRGFTDGQRRPRAAPIRANPPPRPDAPEPEPKPAPPPPDAGPAAATQEQHDPPGRRAVEIEPIRIVAGEIDVTATMGEDALLASGLPVFRRDPYLVRPVSQAVPASGGRMTVAASLYQVTPPAMVDMLNQAVGWVKWNVRSDDWKPCDPPDKVAAIILSRSGMSKLPSVSGVITTPTLRPDGSLLVASGYDKQTRLYHVHDPQLRLPAIPRPTDRLDADRALETLSGLIREFPFVSEVDRSVALSAIITAVVRGAMSVAPMHAIRASTAGSGKSFLADVISMVATGRPCPVMAVASREEETEKRLNGMLLAGYPIVSLDNVNGELGGDLLCMAIERPLVRIRPLGGSDVFEIENRVTLLATGNSLRVRGDMTRRTLLCTLDAGMERPELREFEGDPLGEVARDRGKFVAAVLTIMLAYKEAGRPINLPPLASFGEWHAWVRGALVWLGCADPVASIEDAREDDPELTDLREVVTLWAAALGCSSGYTVRKIDEVSSSTMHLSMGVNPEELQWPDFRQALLRVAGERGAVSPRLLGKWLMRNENRIAAGHKIRRTGKGDGGLVKWGVMRA